MYRTCQYTLPACCVAGLILGVLFLQACSLKKSEPYPRPAAFSQTPALHQEIIQEFLQGRWMTARSLFAQTKENLLRQDDFCAVARLYVLAYKLHAYLGVDYPHLLDKAVAFSQQGLDCGPDLNDRHALVAVPADNVLAAMLNKGKWKALHDHLAHLANPLFVSVYARKAAVRTGQSANKDDAAWTQAFLDQARSIDSNRGWVVFLVQDWKLQLKLETQGILKPTNPTRQQCIKQRIQTLLDLVTPCTQPITIH